jgi:CheY-like chemotaxis protein
MASLVILSAEGKDQKRMEKRQAQASEPRMNKQKNNAEHFDPAVILVVDDNAVQREILRVIPSDEGYQTHVAASAEEALSVTKTLKPDVVLTDFRMHKMNGMELMEQLRSQSNAPEVIIMSA